jgi:alanine racemase
MSDKPTEALSGVRAYIDADSILSNIKTVRSRCASSKIMCVVKANAYGHGLEKIAAIAASAVDGLGVARIEEAIRIRDSGIDQLPILVMSPVKSAEFFEECVRWNLDTVLQEEREIDMLQKLPAGTRLRVWLKMNCGLHRLGFSPEDYPKALERILSLPQVRSVISMTHFSRSSDTDSKPTLKELGRFMSVNFSGVEGSSTANSGGICGFPESHLDWVRPGLLMYGVNPAPVRFKDTQLRPAMRFCAPIIAIREVPKGECVGYGGWWRAPRRSKIAIVGAGYADGYPCYDAGASMDGFVRGRRVAMLGQVSMDMLAVNISDVPGCQIDDLVELWGENISVNEVAERSGRRLYTLLTGISERVPRVYT